MKKFFVLIACLLTFPTITLAKEKDKDFFDIKTYEEVYEEGMYKVGKDIDEGVYRYFSDGDIGAILISNDANQKDFVMVDQAEKHGWIEIKDGQYLKLQQVFIVKQDDIKPIPIKDNKIESGDYLVGFDIPAGEYEIKQVEEYGAYVIHADISREDIVSVGQVNNNEYISLEDGQLLTLKGVEITDDKLVTNELKSDN